MRSLIQCPLPVLPWSNQIFRSTHSAAALSLPFNNSNEVGLCATLSNWPIKDKAPIICIRPKRTPTLQGFLGVLNAFLLGVIWSWDTGWVIINPICLVCLKCDPHYWSIVVSSGLKIVNTMRHAGRMHAISWHRLARMSYTWAFNTMSMWY
jgi:hypothetical protein